MQFFVFTHQFKWKQKINSKTPKFYLIKFNFKHC